MDDGATVTVREATPSDFESWFALFDAVAAEGRWIGAESPIDRAWAEPMFESFLHDDRRVILVAEVGMDYVGHLSIELARGVADLGMMVAAGARGRRVGSALLDACIDWSRRHRAHKVALQVFPHNDAAIGLYRTFGFREEGRLERHWRRRNGELWDVIPMGLDLTPPQAPD